MTPLPLLGVLGLLAQTQSTDVEPALAGPPTRAAAPLAEARLVVVSYETRGRPDNRVDRFVQELGLVLDGFTIEVAKLNRPQFARLSLPNQVAAVEPLLAEHSALAAAWLMEPTPGWLMVYLVAVQTGQTLVRTVQSPGTATEADLALAVRELLGAAWLFAPLDDQGPVAMQQLVESIRDQVTAYGRRYRGGAAVLTLRGDVGVRVALSEQTGADSAIVAGLALESELLEDLWIGLGAQVTSRPGRSTRVFQNISAFGVMPHVTAAYQVFAFELRGGRLSLGPSAGLGFEWEQFSFQLGESENSYGAARMRAWGGLDLRWFFSRRVGVVFSPRVGWTSNRGVYRAASTNDLLVATPRNDWGFVLGVMIRPWR